MVFTWRLWIGFIYWCGFFEAVMTLPSGYLSREQREDIKRKHISWNEADSLLKHADVVDLILEEKDREIAALKNVAADQEQELEQHAADRATVRKVTWDIQTIMNTYREQEASRSGIGTPGGLEHMGDVWRLLAKWDKILSEPQQKAQPTTKNRLLEKCAAALRRAGANDICMLTKDCNCSRCEADEVLGELQAAGIGK